MLFGSKRPKQTLHPEVLWIQKSYGWEDEELVTSVLYDLCNTNDLRNLIIPSTIEPYMKVVL